MARPTWKSKRPWVFAAPLVLGVSSVGAAVTISGAPTANVTCTAGVCSATAADAVLNARDLKIMLVSGSITIQSGGAAQDIVVAAPLTWTDGVTLTLDAFRSLTIKSPISVKGSGGLTILTNDGWNRRCLLDRRQGTCDFRQRFQSAHDQRPCVHLGQQPCDARGEHQHCPFRIPRVRKKLRRQQ